MATLLGKGPTTTPSASVLDNGSGPHLKRRYTMFHVYSWHGQREFSGPLLVPFRGG